MANAPIGVVLEHIRTLVDAQKRAESTDGQLLDRFLASREEAAFAALLSRHGPMVLSVCRRVLQRQDDAEDVFQATFLLLARKAGSIRKRESVSSWLHGVAHHLAIKAKAQAARRKIHERRAAIMRTTAPGTGEAWQALQEVLDKALQELPQKYRTALVLCYLEGRSHEEAASQLGCPLTTFRSQLARGRNLLRARLARHGLPLSAGAFGTILAANGVEAALPASLGRATLEACLRFAAGRTVAAVVSSNVATLVNVGMRLPFLSKANVAIALLMGLSLCITGAGVIAHHALAAWPQEAKHDETKPADRPAGRWKAGGEKDTSSDAYGDPLPPGAISRLGTIRFRQGGNLHCLALSPNGKILASGGSGGVIRFWDLATGKELRHIQAHGSQVLCLAFAPDGQALASGTCDGGGARMWEVTTGKELGQFKDNRVQARNVHAVAFSPDGKTLVSGGFDGAIRFWEPATGQQLRVFEGHQGVVTSVTFTPDGRGLISSGSDRPIRLWELSSGKEIRQFLGHGAEILSVAVSRDGKLLASGALDQTVRLWELATGKELRCMKATLSYGSYPCGNTTIVFSSDDRTLAAAGSACTIWDVTSGKETHRFPAPDLASSVVFSKDGKRLLSGAAASGIIRLWDVATGKEVVPFEGPPPTEVHFAVFFPGEKTVATAAWEGVHLWDVATGKQLRKLQPGGGWPVVVSPDGKSLASALGANIQLWDIASDRRLRTFSGHREPVNSLAFSRDGKILVSGGEDLTIRVWDVQTGKQRHWFPAHPDAADRKGVGQGTGYRAGVWILALSADGKTLASCSVGHKNDPRLWLWDLATGKELRPLQQDEVHHSSSAMAFSPDGKILAAAISYEPEAILFWDVASGKRLRLFKAPGPDADHNTNMPFAFSPDGKALAWGGVDAVLHVWEVATRKERCRFQGHRGAITSVAFSADGNDLVSTSVDLTALVWDLKRSSQQPLPTLSSDGADLWADLANEDAAKAYQALRNLVASPEQTVAFLKDHVRPVAALTPEQQRQLRQWIADLDNNRFALRARADQELEKLGELAAPALRDRLAAQTSAEMRRRIELLLEKVDQLPPGPDRLRTLRAVEVLEHIGTPGAKAVLEALGRGNAEARLTQEAKASLNRKVRHPFR